MAIKIGNKMIGETPAEQYQFEKKRFDSRQSSTKKKVEKEGDDQELNFNMEENI